MRNNYTRLCSLALALCMSAATWATIGKVGGVYQIGTVNDLKEFAALVNNGTEPTANGVLTADIDLGTEQVHIGIPKYKGYFDGKGHTVTVNFNATSAETGALFGFLENGGVICNLVTRGTIETSFGKAAGIVHKANSAVVHNCATFIEVKSNFSGDATHGGIVAVCSDGSVWNCFSAMKITGESTENCGGIIGWSQGERVYCRNNLSLAEMSIKSTSGCGAISRNSAYLVSAQIQGHYLQNFYLNAVGDNGKAQQVTEAKLASGEVCYRLNAGMKTPQWFQKEGDPYPLPIQYEGATTVGASVAANCMVTDLAPEATFTFGGGIASTQHEMFHGRCKKCGFLPLEEMEFGLSGTGIVLRDKEDALQYNWYRYYAGNIVNAIMEADIDMGDAPYFGNCVNWTNGEFNGNGHKLTINISDESLEGKSGEWAYTVDKNVDFSVDKAGFRIQPFTKGHNALFFNLQNNATVHDLYISGSIKNVSNTFAATVTQQAAACTGKCVYNLYSDIEIVSSLKGDNSSGGIIGKVNGACNITLENVVFAGKLNCTNGGTQCGGFLGWVGGTVQINNSLMVGDVITAGASGIIARNAENKTKRIRLSNVWYDPTKVLPVGTPVIKDDMGETTGATNVVGSGFAVADGSLTYKLNNNRVENVAWTQTLGEGGDKCPIPLKTHGRVSHISSVGYATQFIPSADVVIPADVEAYAVTVADSKITLNPITDKISKEDAVVLKADEGYYSFVPTTGATKAASNDLKGAATDLTAAQMAEANTGCDKFYALRLNAELEPESVGFYWAAEDGAAFDLEAGKGYLALPASAKPISGFRFSDGGTTGIQTMPEAVGYKLQTTCYNLQGQRVNANAKGIVIVNGKKVIK